MRTFLWVPDTHPSNRLHVPIQVSQGRLKYNTSKCDPPSSTHPRPPRGCLLASGAGSRYPASSHPVAILGANRGDPTSTADISLPSHLSVLAAHPSRHSRTPWLPLPPSPSSGDRPRHPLCSRTLSLDQALVVLPSPRLPPCVPCHPPSLLGEVTQPEPESLPPCSAYNVGIRLSPVALTRTPAGLVVPRLWTPIPQETSGGWRYPQMGHILLGRWRAGSEAGRAC